MVFLIVTRHHPRNHDFNKLDFALSGNFHVNMSFSGPVVVEKNIFK
jgi:hypothetical protein